jgi:hypothetical protein
MQMSAMQYLPLAPGFFAILVGFFFIVLVVLILRSVRYAYEWGLPNLQVINRDVHAAKCANEARDRRAARPIETEPA